MLFAPALSFALAAFAHTPANPTGDIVLQERVPLAFLLSTPTGEIANTSSSELIRIVSVYTERHTNFFLQVTDPQVATDCRGRLGCLVQQLRQPFPKYLLALSNVTLAGEADRLSAVLVDTEIALEYAKQKKSAAGQAVDPEAERDTEARINEFAVILGPERARVQNAAETEAFIEKLFVERLSRLFRDSENWEPYGAIELVVADAGMAINLDGAPVGITRAGTTMLRNVTAGTRKLTVEAPGVEPYTVELTVESGKTTSAAVTVRRDPTTWAPAARTALFWTGAAATAAGVALSAIAIAGHDGDLQPACLAAPGSPCRDGASFQTFGYSPEAAPGDEVNPSGILVAPLGYSLIGAGAAWSLGTLFIGDDGDVPWIQLAAGLAAGAVAYGVSAALEVR